MAALELVYNILSKNFQLVLPIVDGTIISIEWGDGTISTSKNHLYTNSGVYKVSILGSDITSFNYSTPGATGSNYLEKCTSFGEIGLTDLSYFFNNANKLTSVPIILPTTSIITNMSNMFENASLFNQDIGSWDVSNVINMNGMFFKAISFNQYIGSWNVSNVTSMSVMFFNALSFNQDIGGWNVSNVTTMTSMFYNASVFNQNIGSWNVSNVTSMDGMFDRASLFNQDIGAWDVSNVTTMGSINSSGMFEGASSFNQNIGFWDVSSVTDMSFMFSGAS